MNEQTHLHLHGSTVERMNMEGEKVMMKKING